MKKNYPLSRKNDVVVQELDGEVLIYDLNDNKAFCLNETSALVWQMCDGNKSVAEISKSIGKKLNAPASEDLVWMAIDQLKKEKLIENETELISPFLGMNRREVIKKVGLASMIALPLISFIIAPNAAAAQSGTVTASTFAPASRSQNETCFDNTDCIQDPTFGSGCCTANNAAISPTNPRICRAANNGFNCN